MTEVEQEHPTSEAVEQQDAVDQPALQSLSKNQQKKLRKLEMKMKLRKDKRKFEREKKKEKRKLAIEHGIELPPSRKRLRHVVKTPIDITVVIDSSFEQHMLEQDTKKLVKQIQHCYAINRRAEQPFKYCVSSYGGKVQNIIENLAGTHSWDVRWSEKSYCEAFAKENIVYLAAESQNILSTLEEGKVYVIGGLVDHNAKKGLCYKLALEKGIAHAQLPISSYIDMKCRKVLTVDHVFEILHKYHEQKDWESAFFSVIPKRKGALSIAQSSKSSPSELQDEESEFVESEPIDISDSESQSTEGQVSTGPQSTEGQVSTGPQSTEGHVSTGPQSTEGHVSTGPQSTEGQASTGPQSTEGQVSTAPQSTEGQASTGPQSTEGHVSTGPQSTEESSSKPQSIDSNLPVEHST